MLAIYEFGFGKKLKIYNLSGNNNNTEAIRNVQKHNILLNIIKVSGSHIFPLLINKSTFGA